MSDTTHEDTGIVTAIKGRMLTIEIARGGGCKSCSMKSLCGSSNTPIVLELESDTPYQIGDRLIMEVVPSMRIASALIIFLLPLIGMIGGYLSARLFTTELLSILCGFVAMIGVFFIVKWLDKRMAKHISFSIGGKCEDLSE